MVDSDGNDEKNGLTLFVREQNQVHYTGRASRYNALLNGC